MPALERLVTEPSGGATFLVLFLTEAPILVSERDNQLGAGTRMLSSPAFMRYLIFKGRGRSVR